MVNLRPQGHANAFVRVLPNLPWPPPLSGDSTTEVASRRISSKVWDLDEIKQLVRQFAEGNDFAINIITTDCSRDLQKLCLEKADIADFVELLSEKHYLNSAWCMASRRPGVKVSEEARWYPCDAYCLEVIREIDDAEVIENKLYIKMCKTASGKMLLIASMHESIY
jgi:hypothetical protein